MHKKPCFFAFVIACALLALNTASAQSLLTPSACQPWPVNRAIGEHFHFSDLDGDGYPELLAFDGRDLLIFHNQAGIVDSVPEIIPNLALQSVSNFFVTDWNADGLPDLIFQIISPRTYLAINQGGGVFNMAQEIVSDNFQLHSVRDLNGDGWPDAAAVKGDSLQVLLNQAGNVTPLNLKRKLPGYSYGLDVMDFADFSQDGIMEMVLSLDGPYDNIPILILTQNGNFDFTLAQTLYFSPDPVLPYGLTRLICADLDNANGPEILFRYRNQTYVRRHLGGLNFSGNILVGDHAFSTSGTYGVATSLAAIPDLDGNGYPEIAVDNSLFFNNNLTFTEAAVMADPDFSHAFHVPADTDLDGQTELWWVQDRNAFAHVTSAVYRVRHLGGQSLGPRERMWEQFPVESQIRFHDIENDGDMDVLFFSHRKIAAAVNESGVFTPKSLCPTNWNDEYYVMDVDGDGLKDLLFWSAFGIIRWRRNPGNGYVFENQGDLYAYGGFGTFTPLVAADFDGDGVDDLLVAHTAGSNVVMRLLKFNGASFDVLSGEVLELSALYGGAEASVSDLNGDGYPDVLVHLKLNSGAARLLVFHNQAGAGLSRVQTINLGAETVWLGLTDMSLDGLEDVAVRHEPSNQIRYYYAQPDGLFSGNFGASPGAGIVVLLADVNGDGLKDLIRTLELPDSQSVLVALNTGTGFGPYAVQGSGRGIFYPFDYDHDGDLDFYNVWDIYPGLLCLWENQSVSAYRIAGQVFFDANGNGVKEPQEPLLPQIAVGIPSVGILGLTDTAGWFELPMGALQGAFEVELTGTLSAHAQVTTSPYPAVAAITPAAPSDTVLIGIQIPSGAVAQVDQTLGPYGCDGTAKLRINVSAMAALPHTGNLALTLPPSADYVLGSASIAPSGITGNTLHWDFADFPLFQPVILGLEVNMPDAASAGGLLAFSTMLQIWHGSDTLSIPDTLFVLHRCNDDATAEKIIVNVEDFLPGDQYYTLNSPDKVEYLIRFPNTGSDTVFQLTFLDNLSPVMDVGTMEVLSLSHPAQVQLGQDAVLRVNFQEMVLPGDMVYIKFSIKLKPDAPRNTPIRNAARVSVNQTLTVHTNTADFSIVDCEYFARAVQAPRQKCVGTEQMMWVPDRGLEQEFRWYLNGDLVSQSDTVLFDFPNVGWHSIKLEVENGLCTVDTVFQIQAAGITPDVQLSVDSTVSICAGYPLTITSNLSCQWFKDGVLQSTGLNYTADGSQLIRAVATNGACQGEAQTYVQAVAAPDRLIQEGEEGQAITFCEADTIALSASVGGQLLWQAISGIDSVVLVSGASDFSVPGNLVDFSGYIYLWVDTLNCELFDLRYLQRVGDSPLTLEADLVWCGQQIGFGRLLDQEEYQMPIDSVFVYYEDSLVNSWYFTGVFYYFMPGTGEYTFEVFTGCRQETFFLNVTSIDELPPASPVQVNFSLQTSTGQGGTWYYAPDLSAGFSFLQNSVSVFQPQDGYYYFVYSVGNNCGNQISDTVFYQTPPCLPVDTVYVQAGSASAAISWPPPFPGANYIAYLRPAEPDLPWVNFPNFQDTVLHLDNLVPYVHYSFELGLICPDTVAWTLTEFTLGDNLERRSGLFTRCTPRFQRPGGAPGAMYPYDVLPFTVPEDGEYFLGTASPGPAGALPVGLLYEDAFNPAQPDENLILSIQNASASSFPQRVDSTVILSAGKEYFLVSTRENWNEGFIHPDQSIEPRVRFWLAGPAPAQTGDIWYNGRETGPHGVVDEVDASSATDAGFMCYDTSGWAHFYRVAAGPDQYAGDRLKLSMEVYPDLLVAYRIHGPVLVDGVPGASSIVNPPALYVDSTDTWWVMNRFWNFPLDDPQYLQPAGPIRVRFYFTDADYEALQDSIRANSGADFEITDMYFYKINGFHDPFQLNPANGHPGIYAADAYDAPYGYWEYAPGPEATTSTWKYGAFAQGHYAEMVIRWLSGGGGGLSLSGGGAITAAAHPQNGLPDVSVFPVPAADKLHIRSLSENTPLTAYGLYGLNGRLLLSRRFAPTMSMQVGLNTLPSGIYVLKLQAADGRVWVGKVMKK